MYDLCIILLTGHLLGDFVFQPDWLVQVKKHWWGLLLHTAVVTLITALLLATADWMVYPAVFLSHWLVDRIKTAIRRNGICIFLLDQGAHFLLLLGIAWLFRTDFESFWSSHVPGYTAMLTFLSGLILTVPFGNVLVSKATAPLVDELKDQKFPGLTNGGKWIGQLERGLSFFLVCFDQAAAIGFLFAAKSILRFGEIKDPEQRKVSEYIIIGTFMSFGWALIVANMTVRIASWL